MSLPNPGMSFTPFDPLPASDLNDMVENIEALAAGTGLDNGAIGASKVANSAIIGSKYGGAVSYIGGDNTLAQTTTSTTFVNVNAGTVGGWPSITITGTRVFVSFTIPIHCSTATWYVGININSMDYTLGRGNNGAMELVTLTAVITGLTPGGPYTLQPRFRMQAAGTATITGFNSLILSAFEV